MSEDRTYLDYVRDITDELDRIEKFVEHLSYDDFSRDKKTVYAVVRAFEIIGEAVKNIPKRIRDKYPDIPWRKMAGMRDKLIHEYSGVDVKTLWETVRKRVPEVKPLMEKVLRDLER